MRTLNMVELKFAYKWVHHIRLVLLLIFESEWSIIFKKVLVISTLEFDQVCQELEAALVSELLRGLSQLSSSGWKKHYLPGKSYVE
jgi:hypothetical protein